MSDRQVVASLLGDPDDETHLAYADAIFASDWLAEHDREVAEKISDWLDETAKTMEGNRFSFRVGRLVREHFGEGAEPDDVPPSPVPYSENPADPRHWV